jgi:hypothetical protein
MLPNPAPVIVNPGLTDLTTSLAPAFHVIGWTNVPAFDQFSIMEEILILVAIHRLAGMRFNYVQRSSSELGEPYAADHQ